MPKAFRLIHDFGNKVYYHILSCPEGQIITPPTWIITELGAIPPATSGTHLEMIGTQGNWAVMRQDFLNKGYQELPPHFLATVGIEINNTPPAGELPMPI